MALQQPEPSTSAELGVPSLEELRAEIREYSAQSAAKSTQKKMKNAIKRFQHYICERGEDKHLLELDIEYLDALLAVYVKTLKKANGEHYEPVTVQSYSGCIRKYLSENMSNVDQEKSFPVTQAALQAKKKELKGLGKGNSPNKADGLSVEQEEHLWQCGALGDTSPDTLMNTLWYLTTKLLGFRGGQEAKQLLWSDIRKIEMDSGDCYLLFNKRWTKTRDGIKNNKREFPPKMFQNKVNPERCPVRLYELFEELRPAECKCPAFFLSVNHNPKATTWYADAPMGINRLDVMMHKIADEANLKGKFTNHNVRRTMCSQLLNSGQFDAVTVAQLSGYKIPNSLKHYMIADIDTQQSMCEYLQNPRKRRSIDSHRVQSMHEIESQSLPALPCSQTTPGPSPQMAPVTHRPPPPSGMPKPT